MRTLIGGLGVIGLLTLAGCPQRAPVSAATLRAQDLPADPAKLGEMSAELVEKGDPVSLENALVVDDKALSIAQDPAARYAAAWRAARDAFRLADAADHDKGRRGWFSRKGSEYAAQATAADGKGVEGHYYRALDLGYLASTKTLGALSILPDIVKEAEAAIAANEKYDHCGPLRVLGALLIKAPKWPTSVGDPEDGAERLARATQLCPDYPVNHLYYAEALLANKKPCDAIPELQKVIDAPTNPEWAYTQPRAHDEAQAQLVKAQERCKR